MIGNNQSTGLNPLSASSSSFKKNKAANNNNINFTALKTIPM